ncbi:hypothetical protein, partial [Teichococcus wenyumeiae]|uniref:hypothetical protein n=1 Tax=Teichococcus wenyumeiae TaxID=2478470 RepID=UPI001F3CA3A4
AQTTNRSKIRDRTTSALTIHRPMTEGVQLIARREGAAAPHSPAAAARRAMRHPRPAVRASHRTDPMSALPTQVSAASI